MGRILESSIFRATLGLTIPQTKRVCTVFTYGYWLYFIVSFVTIAGSIALQFMNDAGQRKTLIATLIGLNAVAILPIVASIIMDIVRKPSGIKLRLLLLLLIVGLTSPIPYLLIARYLEQEASYPTVKEGLLVITAILPALTGLPVWVSYLFWECFNCEGPCD